MNLTDGQYRMIMAMWRKQGDRDFSLYPLVHENDEVIARNLVRKGLLGQYGSMVFITVAGLEYCNRQPV